MKNESGAGTAPALVEAYLECPNCGRIPKPTGTLLVLPTEGAPARTHCCAPCDRCGSTEAILYLERKLMPRH